VGGAIEIHHLAERYGVARGRSAIVATQSNFGYRLALRLHDAGVAIRRVVDTRVNPQSRFVDFAKASGLTLGGGQVPVSASLTATRGVHAGFANAGTSQVALNLEAEQLVVSGSFQPSLRLWMLAGGATDWRHGRLEAAGHVERLALAGAAAGYRSMTACAESGRQAQALLFGGTPRVVEDREIDPMYETPDGTTAISPAWTGTAFLDAGTSLVMRPAAAGASLPEVAALSLADVAASVDLGLIATTDAGAVAEERGAPGADLAASSWAPAPLAAPETPAWLASRFGAEPVRVHLIVDDRRTFEVGALVYANTSPADPARAIGVIVAAAPEGRAGGIALVQKSAAGRKLRFVVETMRGPSPARPATD
jgi:sarcosine oxidase subunit alpha